MPGPGDLSGVQALIDRGALDPARIVAVMGKTEGNGCVNDHTRDFASSAWCHFLAPHLQCTAAEVAQRVALVSRAAPKACCRHTSRCFAGSGSPPTLVKPRASAS